MYLVKSIDVWSCAKMAGVFYGLAGLLVIPIALISIAASAGSQHPYGAFGAVALILLAILAPVFYGLLGFLLGALSAWLYNLAAKHIGGIRIDFTRRKHHRRPSKGHRFDMRML